MLRGNSEKKISLNNSGKGDFKKEKLTNIVAGRVFIKAEKFQRNKHT